MHTYNTHNIINIMQIQNNTTQYCKHNTGYTYGKHNTIHEKHNTTKNYAGLIHTAEYTGNSANTIHDLYSTLCWQQRSVNKMHELQHITHENTINAIPTWQLHTAQQSRQLDDLQLRYCDSYILHLEMSNKPKMTIFSTNID